MPTYRKRAVDVEMICWTGHNFGEIIAFVENEVVAENVLLVKNPIAGGLLPFWCAASQAEVTISPGGWVAREVDGSGFYPLTEQAQRDGFDRLDADGVVDLDSRD